jgi:hypothetical protein
MLMSNFLLGAVVKRSRWRQHATFLGCMPTMTTLCQETVETSVSKPSKTRAGVIADAVPDVAKGGGQRVYVGVAM